MSTSQPPTWPHCARGADPAGDPVGCRGIHVPGHTACLAHLTDADRDAYLAALTPWMASLRGVDAAHLVQTALDLSGCLFAGTVHLDQLSLEGACTFDTAPPAEHWRRWPPVRFTERRVLAEEHHWRAGQPGAVRGWNVAVLGAGRAPPRVAPAAPRPAPRHDGSCSPQMPESLISVRVRCVRKRCGIW